MRKVAQSDLEKCAEKIFPRILVSPDQCPIKPLSPRDFSARSIIETSIVVVEIRDRKVGRLHTAKDTQNSILEQIWIFDEKSGSK